MDLLSMAANQFYGPSGVGALYIRSDTRIIPLLDGGIQENNRRAGTQNMLGIVGMGKAAELAKKDMSGRTEYLLQLKKNLVLERHAGNGLPAGVPRSHLHREGLHHDPGDTHLLLRHRQHTGRDRHNDSSPQEERRVPAEHVTTVSEKPLSRSRRGRNGYKLVQLAAYLERRFTARKGHTAKTR